MLIDLLDSTNYLNVNITAVNIFGLNTAVYCGELINIFKKAVKKNKLFNDEFFKVDRKYITSRTALSLDEQYQCDANLAKVKILSANEADPDIIRFDINQFASILTCEDMTILDGISKKFNTSKSTSAKQKKQISIINALKNSIECNDYDILKALYDWIDSITSNNRALSTQQVTIFKNTLDRYCMQDKEKALAIIRIAIVQGYVNCDWAINVYEKDNHIRTTYSMNTNQGSRSSVTILTEQREAKAYGDIF